MPSPSISVASGATGRLGAKLAPAGDLAPRIVSSVVLAAVALLALFGGAAVFAALVLAAAIVLGWEWCRITRRDAGMDRVGGAVIAGAALVVMLGAARFEGAALAVAAAVVAATMALASSDGRAAAFWAGLGVCWIGLPCLALVWLRQRPSGEFLVFWLLVVVWMTDIAAFAAGRAIGGAKLAPTISPKKTWAGLIGAILGAAATSMVVGLVAQSELAAAKMAAAGAAAAVIAQAGDLAESFVKRRFGVKDSSNLIPGHGGVFDRVDGLLAASVAVALWMIVGAPGV